MRAELRMREMLACTFSFSQSYSDSYTHTNSTTPSSDTIV